MQHSLDLQWPPEDLQELALPTPENQMAASYLKKCAIQRNKKDILAKKNPFTVGRSYNKRSW